MLDAHLPGWDQHTLFNALSLPSVDFFEKMLILPEKIAMMTINTTSTSAAMITVLRGSASDFFLIEGFIKMKKSKLNLGQP